MNIERYNIGKVAISKTNLNDTLEFIDRAFQENKLGYICVTNSRTTYLANHNNTYLMVQNNSMLTVPDGTPLVWIAHFMGYKNVGRVSGPKLMSEILSISKKINYSHYFFGSTPNVIEKMSAKLKSILYDIEIKGLVSPPFQPIEQFDIDSLAEKLNYLKPSFFWCGLGAPKQEILISLLQPKLNYTICIGVGLAFEHFAGTVLSPPKIVSILKIEWLFRCFQQPIKARRFVVPFFWMVGVLLNSFLIYKIKKKKD